MTDIFLKVVNMSLSASWLILAVIAARFLLKKAPKWINVLLWGLVAVRLLCPFTLESALSLIPSTEVVSPEVLLSPTPAIESGIPAVDSAVNPVIAEQFAPEPAASANPLQVWIPILAVLWIVGMAAMGEYTLFTYQRLRRQVRLAIRVSGNVYLSENIPSPFVLGVFRPRIYIPYGMTEQDMAHVIAHEKTHIRRRDHWWKPLGFTLLAVHWFNPLMWLAYILLCRDIELACDEKVIRELGVEQRADYSQALLNCAVSHRSIAACPVAFGEVGVKERVKNILTYRKPAFWIMVIAVILCIVVAVCFLTDPKVDLIDRIVDQDGYRILFQTEYTMEMSIPKRDYPEDCYTVEGHSFRQGEYVSGSSFGNMYYLTHMGYSDETEEYLRFTFDFFYEPTGNTVLVPYRLLTEDGATVGKEASLSIRNNQLFAEEGSFDQACYSGWIEGSQKFYVDIRRDAWEYARTGVYFTIEGFHRLTFEKEPLFGNVTPRPITHSLIVEDIDIAQATFWGESTMHLVLDQEQIGELVQILYQLPPDDFEPAVFPVNTISLMIGCGDREILLKTNGSYVWFTFDSETAAGIDGDWMTQDEELLRFLAGLSGYADAESFYGVYLTVEEVSATGATVVFGGTGEKPAGRLMGGNDYWVQVDRDGVWEDVTKVPEPSFTTENYDIDNIRRHKIDWQWRYGILPSGHYRIGKDVTYQEGAKLTETATVWAEFTLTESSFDISAFLASLDPAMPNASAEFVGTGSGYTFFPEETAELVSLLKGLDPSALTVSAQTDPVMVIRLSSEPELSLSYNGFFAELSFPDNAYTTRWTVHDPELNPFLEQILTHSPERSTYEIYNVAPLEDIPETYSLEEATIDKVVIQIDGVLSYNQDIWQEFLSKTTAGTPATVRIMHYQSPAESEPGYKILYDLTYDGNAYLWESVQDGIYYADELPYLRYFSLEPDDEDEFGPYDWDACEYYVLTDSEAETWKEVYHESHSWLVLQNLIYNPKQPQIPYPVSAELRINGLPLVIADASEQVHDLYQLMSQAEYIGYAPKTYNLGTELVFTGKDGGVTRLELDLDSDLFRYDGLFYDYGPGVNSNGGVNNLPVLWGMLGLEDWPEEVKQAYPDFFGEIGDQTPAPANDLFLQDSRDMVIGVWYPDWSYLEIFSPQALYILEALNSEAPNPTDEEIPEVTDTVFTIHLAFNSGAEFDLAYMGQTEYYLRDFQTDQVYRFSSEHMRQILETAISETKAALYS